MKKNEQNLRNVRHLQAYQYVHNESLQGEKRKRKKIRGSNGRKLFRLIESHFLHSQESPSRINAENHTHVQWSEDIENQN